MHIWACTNQGGGPSRPPTAVGQRGGDTLLYMLGHFLGNAVHAVRTHCACSAKFWMLPNTQTLLLAPLTSFWFHTGGF